MNNTHTESAPMDAETLEALRGSIAKWEAIVAGTGNDEGPENCPLCLKFNRIMNPSAERACAGCPVRERSGAPYCEQTPYWDYDDDDEHNEAAAQAELDFLKSLLPEDSVSDETKVQP